MTRTLLLFQSHFKPELPDDTVIHFHINCSRLVLTILSVSHTSKPASNNTVNNKNNIKFAWICIWCSLIHCSYRIPSKLVQYCKLCISWFTVKPLICTNQTTSLDPQWKKAEVTLLVEGFHCLVIIALWSLIDL